jgi:5-formyltetrahydrofolate cyclo-ligase
MRGESAETDHDALTLPDLPQLRASIRQRRKSVSPEMRHSAACAVARRLARLQLLHRRRRIGVYSAIDGELDLTPLAQYAQRIGCTLYAPRIVNMRARKMDFVEVPRLAIAHTKRNTTESLLKPRLNLQRRMNPRLLDVVFVPLVAFNTRGWRLGFGAGFYDRKFAFMRRGFRNKPLLIGVGYEFQRVSQHAPQLWDVMLHAVVTEQRLYRCQSPKTFSNWV